MNLAELYGLPLVDWQRVEARLAAGPGQLAGTGGQVNRRWLATTNLNGSPHLTGLGPLWVSGLVYFTTGETTRKGRNLARDPRCRRGDGRPLGGRWVAGQRRRDRFRVDGRVQRAVRGAAAVAGLSAHAPLGLPTTAALADVGRLGHSNYRSVSLARLATPTLRDGRIASRQQIR